MEQTSSKFVVTFSIILISIGLIANHWVLGYLFSQDGKIETVNLIFIWIFQIVLFFSGTLLLLKRKTFDIKKFFFVCITMVLIFVSVEIGLHIIDFATHSDKKGVISVGEQKYLLSPYKDKDWAKAYFDELRQSLNFEYQPFLGWRRSSFDGKYINVESDGIRKTWNPKLSGSRNPGTIYVFGGSTAWGYGARDEHTIPSYISKLLSSKGYDFEVINYGESSYTFLNEVVYLTLLLRQGMKPKYVIFYDGCNDVGDAYHTGIPGANTADIRIKNKLNRKDPNPFQHIQIGIDALLKKYSMIYNTISKIPDIISERGKNKLNGSEPVNKHVQILSEGIVKHYEKSHDLLKHLSHTYDFEYLCFWQPVIYTEKEITNEERRIRSTFYTEPISDLFKTVRRALNSRSLSHFFDISNSFDKRDNTYYLDACHVSEQGNEAVAARIVQILEEEYLHKQ